MTALQYITHATYGCCTTGELMQLSRQDKEAYLKLKQYAEEEMVNKGIPLDKQAM